jgi:hypothetical protein
MSSIYSINKGINKPIEFKGLKAQYIWWLGGGLLILLILFAVLYISGVNSFICIIIIVISATALFMHVYRLSRKYGQYGMMKAIAKRTLPKVIKSYSRKPFINLISPISKSSARNDRVFINKKANNRINKSIL